MASSSEFKVCLSAVGKPRKILVVKDTDTLGQVKSMAARHFGFTAQVTFKAGFPPRVLADENTVLARSVLTNNDRVQVESSAASNGDTSSELANGTAAAAAAVADTNGTVSRRSKRSAARAATESFADVIRAQDAMMKQETTKKAKKRKTPNNRATTQAARSQAAAQRRMAQLPGRRLADGSAVGPSPTNRKSRAKFSSQDDISFALLNALNQSSNGSNTQVDQVLRGAMRNAVAQQYETSRAVVRVAAVQSKKYEIKLENDKLLVEYSKGLEGRGMYEERVDYIPQNLLEQVVTAIYNSNKESLRQLAQLSPRVFWSLVYLQQQNSITSMESALQQLLPCLDFAFLSTRIKTLSEKARENKRQEGEAENNWQAAESAVQAVEHAMEQVHEYNRGRLRQETARAAMARLEQVDTWQLTTPTETDEEELRDCIQAGNDNAVDPCLIQSWIQTLIQNDIGNWRQLANTDSEMVASLLQLSPDQVESWIDYAQQESVEEIMVQVCDDNIEMMETLREVASTGTPKDLAAWRSMPDMLLEQLPNNNANNVTVAQLGTWCQRAHDVLQQYEWLNWYATRVSA